MQTIDVQNYHIYITDKQDVDLQTVLGTYYKCEQVHSDAVYVWEDGEMFVQQKWDAIISNQLHTKIAVRVADCSPIVLMWVSYFAIVHAGWRWLQSGIIDKTIKLLYAKGEKKLDVFVWPNIKSCCYEVWPEFKDYFDEKYFVLKWKKLYLDMDAIILDTLMDNWVDKKNIIFDSHCTCCSSKHFSYRGGDRDQRIMIAVEKVF